MNLYIYHVSVIKVAYSTSVGMMGISGQNLNTVVRLWLKDGIICCHKAPNVVTWIKNGSKTWHVWDDETQLGYLLNMCCLDSAFLVFLTRPPPLVSPVGRTKMPRAELRRASMLSLGNKKERLTDTVQMWLSMICDVFIYMTICNSVWSTWYITYHVDLHQYIRYHIHHIYVTICDFELDNWKMRLMDGG